MSRIEVPTAEVVQSQAESFALRLDEEGRLVRYGPYTLSLAKGLAAERIEDIRSTAGQVIVVTVNGRRLRRLLRYTDPAEAKRCADRMQAKYGGVIGRYRVEGRPDSWGYCVHPEGMDGDFSFSLG